jgi:hypothetical protein
VARAHHHRKPDIEVHHYSLTPNLVITGSTPWERDRPVRWAIFTFDGSRHTLFENQLIKRTHEPASDLSFGKTVIEGQLFSIETPKYRVSVSKVIDNLQATEPRISIDFLEGAGVFEYVEVLHDIVVFFALSGGFSSRPGAVSISPLSWERLNAVADESHQIFGVRYRWLETATPSALVGPHSSVFQVLNDQEKSHCAGALKLWLERREFWHSSYGLASNALRSVGTIDRNRLLSAFGWFESIPVGPVTPELSPENVQ